MNAVEGLRLVLVVVHLLGMTAVVGPGLLQRRGRGPVGSSTMLAGAVVALGSGAGLYAVRTAEGLPVTGTKIAVKAGLSLVVLTLAATAFVRERRGRGSGVLLPRAAAAIGALTVGVAVLWT